VGWKLAGAQQHISRLRLLTIPQKAFDIARERLLAEAEDGWVWNRDAVAFESGPYGIIWDFKKGTYTVQRPGLKRNTVTYSLPSARRYLWESLKTKGFPAAFGKKVYKRWKKHRGPLKPASVYLRRKVKIAPEPTPPSYPPDYWDEIP
jgi:hypothetical protein